jgi:hypothetical protein
VQVRVAFWLQFGAVVVLLGLAGLVASYAVHFDHVISEVAARFPGASDEVGSERTGNLVSALVLGIPVLLLAIWYGATLMPVWRGSNVARILVFVAAGGMTLLGLSQVCSGGFPLLLLSFAFDDGEYADGTDGAQGFLDALYNRSDTFTDVAAGVGVGGLLLVILLSGAVALLLAVPPSHRYFVPRAAVPPMPMAVPYGYLHPGPYMICPDPSAHLPRAEAGPEATAP